MDKFKLLLRSELCGLREQGVFLLRQHTIFADLIYMINHRQSAHELVAPQLPQRPEIEVPIPLMPAPSDVAGAGFETHRHDDIHVEEVQLTH